LEDTPFLRLFGVIRRLTTRRGFTVWSKYTTCVHADSGLPKKTDGVPIVIPMSVLKKKNVVCVERMKGCGTNWSVSIPYTNTVGREYTVSNVLYVGTNTNTSSTERIEFKVRVIITVFLCIITQNNLFKSKKQQKRHFYHIFLD